MLSVPHIDRPPVGWHFDNSYARLPGILFAKQCPEPVRTPRLVIVNPRLAAALGLDLEQMTQGEAAALFAGNSLPEGAEPLAQAYAGHQFGHFNILGDGRAIVIGEHIAFNSSRYDIQLKGSGQTPYSRRGDGRAALGPMLREYILSEAMHALGIPSTRSLAIVTSGEPVRRERLLPGAILTRVAQSHIRVGTFQFVAAQRDPSLLRLFADYTIERHYRWVNEADNPYLSMLDAVAERQARLIARWQLVGFIHGVMNTDNMAIAGETIDYGPCAFMDAYDPACVFSSIDYQGRYAYANQPIVAQWNLARLAETLLPLIAPDEATAIVRAEDVLDRFSTSYQRYWLEGMRSKLGLIDEETGDRTLIEDLLAWMHAGEADFTNTFRALAETPFPTDDTDQDKTFRDWQARWQARIDRNGVPFEDARALMQRSNPAVIPRNHRVEEALDAASEHGDLTPLHALLAALEEPYADRPEYRDYRRPPEQDERVLQTFCGT